VGTRTFVWQNFCSANVAIKFNKINIANELMLEQMLVEQMLVEQMLLEQMLI
jgi:hypothetical protein